MTVEQEAYKRGASEGYAYGLTTGTWFGACGSLLVCGAAALLVWMMA